MFLRTFAKGNISAWPVRYAFYQYHIGHVYWCAVLGSPKFLEMQYQLIIKINSSKLKKKNDRNTLSRDPDTSVNMDFIITIISRQGGTSNCKKYPVKILEVKINNWKKLMGSLMEYLVWLKRK